MSSIEISCQPLGGQQLLKYSQGTTQPLPLSELRLVVERAPLASIDLCIVHCGHLLVGRRTNDPLKGSWFTPGGCIRKGEAWTSALIRVAREELSFVPDVNAFNMMGIWDHFYDHSAVDSELSTHYVNLPHFYVCDVRPSVQADRQHSELAWISLEKIGSGDDFHPYLRSYAKWLLTTLEFE